MATLAPKSGADGRLRIYRLPADRVLRALPARSISLLVTDPPYSTVDRHGGSDKLTHWFSESLSWQQVSRILVLGRTRLRHDGLVLVMTNAAGLVEAMSAVGAAGFGDVRPMVWDRCYPGLGSGLRHQVEYILVGRQPGSRALSGTDLVSVAAVGPNAADRYPTQKPDQLGRVLARMAGIGPRDLVVDPFCGSGALLVGAAERGAVVIGSDISGRAVRLAAKRLAAAARSRAPSSLEGRRTAGASAYRNSARGSKPLAPRPRR
jgi:hypothetical protein